MNVSWTTPRAPRMSVSNGLAAGHVVHVPGVEQLGVEGVLQQAVVGHAAVVGV
jgi:hypothetical protein